MCKFHPGFDAYRGDFIQRITYNFGPSFIENCFAGLNIPLPGSDIGTLYDGRKPFFFSVKFQFGQQTGSNLFFEIFIGFGKLQRPFHYFILKGCIQAENFKFSLLFLCNVDVDSFYRQQFFPIKYRHNVVFDPSYPAIWHHNPEIDGHRLFIHNGVVDRFI